MSDLKNYRFPKQGIELNNAYLKTIESVYNVNGGTTLVVNAVMDADGMEHKCIYLGTMDNTIEWTDVSIVTFAESALKTYEY